MILLEPTRTAWDLSFRLFGVSVRVHPLFWLITAILGWSAVEMGLSYLLVWVACVFASILLHEFGHVLMGRVFGSDGHIVLYSFGGLAIGSSDVPRRWQRIAVLLAGPGAQLLLWGGLRLLLWQGVLNRTLLTSPLLLIAVADLLTINLYWPLMNLLPVWPLDGGQISRELLTGTNAREGLRRSLQLSVWCAGLLAFLAVISWLAPDIRLPTFLSLGFFGVLLFGSLAYSSYLTLQQLNSGPYDSGGGSCGWEQRAPWEQDPDYWKR